MTRDDPRHDRTGDTTGDAVINPQNHADTETSQSKPKVRATYLSPPAFHRLDWACRPIVAAFGEPIYLVGSALTRPDYRDIDLRLILGDDTTERLFNTDTYGIHANGNGTSVHLLLNIALSDLIAKAANQTAPIDFQIQSVTEAQAEGGPRNPIGIPGIGRRL